MRRRVLIVFLATGLALAACAGSATEVTKVTTVESAVAADPTGGSPTAAEQYGVPDPDAGLWVLIDENQMVEDLRPTEEESSEVPPGEDATSASIPPKVPIEPLPSTTTPPAVGEVPEALLAAVIADTAGRVGAAESSVAVVRAQAVTWNDGSLGCPSPSQMYTQALVNGYWIVVGVDGREYDYRASQEGYFKLCVGGGIDPYAVDH